MTKLGAVPAVILAFLIGLTIAFQWSGDSVFNPPYLLMILNVIFLTGTGIVIAFISAKSYLNHGVLNILLLGSAVLMAGLVAAIAGVASYISPNYNNAIYNSGILVSSALQFVSATVTLSGAGFKGFSNRKVLLTIAFAAVTIFVVTLTSLVFGGFAPAFLSPEGVPTLTRQLTLGLSGIFFALGFILFGWQYYRKKSQVIFFYCVALGLFAIGLTSAFGVKHSGELLTWLARLTLYVGSLYFVVAVLASRTEKDSNQRLTDTWAAAFRSDSKYLSDLFANMLNGFTYNKIITDKQGKPVDYVFLEINHSFERMTGLHENKIIGKRVTEVIPGAENEDWIGIYGQVAIAGESLVFESYSKQLNKWFNISAYSPEKGYFVALFEDITERKKAGEALRESELRLRFHSENIPLAMVEWDSNFVVTRWAGDAEKMFGWNASETVGKPIMDLRMIYEPDIPIVEKTMVRLTSGATKVVSSNRNITKDSRIIYCTWYNSVLLDEEGKMVSVFSFVEDNTPRVKAEKSFEENNRNLERLVEDRTKQLKDSERLAAIGATAGMVGHDIRNPLQAIAGELYLAKDELYSLPESDSKKNLLESVTNMEENLFYVDKIIADLQDFTKPLRPVREEVDIAKVVEEALLIVNIPNNLQVVISIEKDFPTFTADFSMLKRVFMNLIQNAVQAMTNGGILEIKAKSDKKQIILCVKDTGEGVPEEVKDKLFTPLFTTKSKGQGLGLAVVKRLVEAQGGKISFESQKGKGTTFTVRLTAAP